MCACLTIFIVFKMSESPTSVSPKRQGALAGIDPVEFLLAGIAACGAGFFSNPLEVVKTRMQLQGELKARGQYAVHYRNVFHAFYTVAKADGFIAIQKGLVPALWYQFLMNGFRLGTYQIINNLGLTKDSWGELSLPRSVLAGAASGSMGAFVGSPIYMIKTHLQSKAVKEIAVGHQHSHQSMIQGLLHIHSKFGILGLWRGVSAAIPRVMVGSASQLSTFTLSKNYIEKTKIFSHGSWLNSFSAAMISGVAVTVCMTPFDVVSTRMYNQGTDAQGRGLYYSGFLDCFNKIFRTEGVWGFYKGWAASFFRLGPHTILSLVFWNEGRKLYFKLQNKANEKSPEDTR